MSEGNSAFERDVKQLVDLHGIALVVMAYCEVGKCTLHVLAGASEDPLDLLRATRMHEVIDKALDKYKGYILS
jgi:hypothetical protein